MDVLPDQCPAASTESPPERTGRRRSMPGSPADKATPSMEVTPAAATPFRVTVSTVSSLSSFVFSPSEGQM